MSEKNKEIVKQVDASFAENNIEGFFKHCDENIEWKMVGDNTAKGLENIREWMNSMPNHDAPKFVARTYIAEGDSVASHGSMKMKNESGEEEAYDYCDIYRFENDKIVELTSFVIKTDK